MSFDDEEDKTIYNVVVNHEEQYSIWPKDRDIPLGWKAVGKSGLKGDCLDFIKVVWTDMRPLSLQKKMQEAEQRREAGDDDDEPSDEPHPAEEGGGLVARLSTGDHAVEASVRPEKTVQGFREAIDRNFVHIRFTETRGGTELGFELDTALSDLSQGDFQQEKGVIKVAGELSLDYERVRCVAEIDLSTLQGRGRLEKL